MCNEWRDIETAPKDGTEIILRRGERVGAAQWIYWPASHEQCAGEGWTIGLDGDAWDEGKEPTHWMPMPTASLIEPHQKGERDAG